MNIRNLTYGFLLTALISTFIPAGVTMAAQGPGYAISINSEVITGYQLDLAGTASADPYVGQFSQQYVTIDWDDGNVELANTNLIDGPGPGKTFTGTWDASHTYAASGTYNVTAKVHHQNAQGAEGSDLATVTIQAEIPPLATLNVIKTVVNDDAGTNVAADFTMSVTGTDVSSSSFAGSESGTAVTLTPGSYSVDEVDALGYTKTLSSDCSGTIADGETKTCTITNDDPTGTTPTETALIIVKQVVNDNGGTLTPADFTMNVTGTNVSDTGFAGSDNGTKVTLDAGSYSVDEDDVAGYAKSLSSDCSGTISEGETKTCTITNDDIAPQLTVTKIVVNDDGGTAVVADFTLYVDAAAVTSGATNTYAVGDYTVSEDNLSGYSATIGGDCDSAGLVSLALGDNKSCTITNNDSSGQEPTQGTLVVIKNVVNDNGGTLAASDFTMNVTAVNPSSSSFAGSATGTAVSVDPGDYSIDEDAVTGYEKSLGDDCTGTIRAGETVTCTITNDDIAPLLTVTKVVVNDGGGELGIPDFPLYVCPAIVGDTAYTSICVNLVTSGEENSYSPGNYVVSEINSSDYTATISGDCDASGNVTLAIGDVKSCTITNDDPGSGNGEEPTQGTLIVEKHVINDNGGTSIAANFTINVTGTNPSQTSFAGSESGIAVTLDPGSYSVDESPADGYEKIMGDNCSGVIEAGETITCSITNDDIATGGGSSGGGGGYLIPRTNTPSPEPESTPEPTVETPEPVLDEEGGEVLSEEACGIYLQEFIHIKKENNPEEVIKLKLFLNEYMQLDLDITGAYDVVTYNAVKQFQTKEAGEVLEPWGINAPTGYVYKTTRRRINNIKCPALNLDMPSPLTPDTDVHDNQ